MVISHHTLSWQMAGQPWVKVTELCHLSPVMTFPFSVLLHITLTTISDTIDYHELLVDTIDKYAYQFFFFVFPSDSFHLCKPPHFDL